MDHLKQLELLSECHACVTPFQLSDVPLRLPTRGKRCSHRICQSCILECHIREENHYRRFLNCPACLSPKSFHAKRPTVDVELCQALSLAPKRVRQQLIRVHQQPWKLPLGVYANLLERVGRWDGDKDSSNKMAISTLHGIVQGLLQVHDF